MEANWIENRCEKASSQAHITSFIKSSCWLMQSATICQTVKNKQLNAFVFADGEENFRRLVAKREKCLFLTAVSRHVRARSFLLSHSLPLLRKSIYIMRAVFLTVSLHFIPSFVA